MTWFKGQAADFYDSGIQKLIPRFNTMPIVYRNVQPSLGKLRHNCVQCLTVHGLKFLLAHVIATLFEIMLPSHNLKYPSLLMPVLNIGTS